MRSMNVSLLFITIYSLYCCCHFKSILADEAGDAMDAKYVAIHDQHQKIFGKNKITLNWGVGISMSRLRYAFIILYMLMSV